MCAAPATQVLHSEKYLIISFSYKLVDSTKKPGGYVLACAV